MITRQVFFICLFSLLISPVFSQFQITIKGHFPGAQGQTVRLMQYADQISYHEMEIASAVVNQDEIFELKFSRFETQYVFFRIDHARMGIFVEPGLTYHLEFEPVNFAKLDDSRNPYLESRFFKFQIAQPSPDLNYYINQLESEFEEFLLEHFVTLHRTRNRRIFEDFKALMDEKFDHFDNAYFRTYYDYKFANYARIANIQRPEILTHDFIFNKPVLYQNTQYMNFFNTVFDTYVFAGSRQITITDLRHTVNNLNSYGALMDSLGKDTLLRNEVLRELVLIKALQDMYDNPDFRQGHVHNILETIQEKSKFAQHRAIAHNVLARLNRLRPGTAAPQVQLMGPDGQPITFPSDFKGKFVYIGFWATWCDACKLDLIALHDLYEKYNKDFVFLMISSDRNKEAFQKYINENPEPWLNVHFEQDFRLLDAFGMRNLPLFLIVDPQGNIIHYPALQPIENITPIFNRLLFSNRR